MPLDSWGRLLSPCPYWMWSEGSRVKHRIFCTEVSSHLSVTRSDLAPAFSRSLRSKYARPLPWSLDQPPRANMGVRRLTDKTSLSERLPVCLNKFFPVQSSSVFWLAPYSWGWAHPLSLVFFGRGAANQGDWRGEWGYWGLNEGISRDSLLLKEAFSGEVNGNAVTPSRFHPLQRLLLFHGLLLRPAEEI